MKYDLLVSKDKRSYFINCTVSGELLKVGAVYIAPFSLPQAELYSEDGGKLTVVIPPDAVDSHEELVAADTSFFID
jgi:hypothetical protein